MTEDEFVVLVEHAGLVDVYDGLDCECVEQRQVIEWLEREGAALFKDRAFRVETDELDGRGAAHAVLAQMLEKQWLLRVDRAASGDSSAVSQQPQLLALRMSTTDAYRLYIEKDAESTLTSRSWSGRSFLESLRLEQPNGSSTRSSSSVSSSMDEMPDAVRQMRIREKMWQDCFPTCSESARQLFFSLTNPVVIMYATMGLNLIGNGISSVPAFSRELKSLNVSHEDRSVIIGFLSRAFPCE